MTLHVSMSHNLTTSSPLPLTTFFPSGDNAILYTSLSPSLQASPICFPLFKFHTRSEPSFEQVMIRCPPGRCMAPQTESRLVKPCSRTSTTECSAISAFIDLIPKSSLTRTTMTGGQNDTINVLVQSELNVMPPGCVTEAPKNDLPQIKTCDSL
ncbi:hypothetical protein BDR03DRAFT_971359, partial [Suillus americanus]